jgi:hypothetical protein
MNRTGNPILQKKILSNSYWNGGWSPVNVWLAPACSLFFTKFNFLVLHINGTKNQVLHLDLPNIRFSFQFWNSFQKSDPCDGEAGCWGGRNPRNKTYEGKRLIDHLAICKWHLEAMKTMWRMWLNFWRNFL